MSGRGCGTTRVGSATVRPSSDQIERAAEHAQALAAELLGQVDLPEAELLAALGEAGLDLGLELLAVERLALDRDQLFIDEPPHHIAQHFQFVGEIELHKRTHGLQEDTSSYEPLIEGG